MSPRTRIVLVWFERIAASVLVVVPAFRAVASQVDSAKAETARIRKGEE